MCLCVGGSATLLCNSFKLDQNHCEMLPYTNHHSHSFTTRLRSGRCKLQYPDYSLFHCLPYTPRCVP